MKRFFDLSFAIAFTLLLFPIFCLIALAIALETRGGVFYVQKRVGKNEQPFGLYKFRTMRIGSDKEGLLTLGNKDPRVTSVGYILRKYKFDEFPQIINIIKNEMSVVGPRPEVQKYTDMYNEEQKKVLSVKPGLTDYASIKYMDESVVLGQAKDSESLYISQIMPDKLALNLVYLQRASFWEDLKILGITLKRIFVGRKQ